MNEDETAQRVAEAMLSHLRRHPLEVSIDSVDNGRHAVDGTIDFGALANVALKAARAAQAQGGNVHSLSEHRNSPKP